MTPREIQTGETLKFVRESLPPGTSRILEVGCGGGALAKKLQGLGHVVVAVDSSAEAVEAARALGVDARRAAFPDFAEEPFDAILFTRSLHHIRPLAPALDRTRSLLKPAGLLVVEDFAYSDASGFTAVWLYRLLRLLESCDVLLPAPDSFGRKLLAGGGDVSFWRDHVHEINTAREVSEAVGERFDVLGSRAVPYLYRYASDVVSDDEQGGEIIAAVLELESVTGGAMEHFLLGRRLVARSRDAL